MTRILQAMLLALAASMDPAANAQEPRGTPVVAGTTDGARDFDWEIGRWTTHVRRLRNPLSGSQTWDEYEGVSIVRPLLEGRANIVELSVAGKAGKIEGLSLRLYNPMARQWSLHFAPVVSGELTAPVTGSFDQGRGEFYSQEIFNGRRILVRFAISRITPDSARFAQAFSDDGGRTWEVNWIATDTRVQNEPK